MYSNDSYEKLKQEKIEKLDREHDTKAKTTTIALGTHLREQLTALAKHIGITRSELIRHCIYQGLPLIWKKQEILEDPTLLSFTKLKKKIKKPRLGNIYHPEMDYSQKPTIDGEGL